MRRLNYCYVYPHKCIGLILDCLYKCWQEMDISDEEYNYLLTYLERRLKTNVENNTRRN